MCDGPPRIDVIDGPVIGIDPGTSRVGLAVSDPLRITAQGLTSFVRGRGSFMAHLGELVHEHEIAGFVVGYPLHMDGSEGDSARSARNLARKLREQFGLPAILWDERLSSVAARRAFPPGSKKDWDRIAAVFILQSYLDACSQSGGEHASDAHDGEGP